MHSPEEEYHGYHAEEYQSPSAATINDSKERYTYQTPPYDVSGQKINQYGLSDNRSSLSAGQRLALGIVSVVMFVPISAILLGSTDYSSTFVAITKLIGLGCIALAILGINIAFNWRRS